MNDIHLHTKQIVQPNSNVSVANYSQSPSQKRVKETYTRKKLFKKMYTQFYQFQSTQIPLTKSHFIDGKQMIE